jgi:glutamate-5-semialdehyde dehydrogenase
MDETTNAVIEVAKKARIASYELAQFNRDVKDKALIAMADALVVNINKIVKANQIDVENAKNSGTDAAIIDRLRSFRHS